MLHLVDIATDQQLAMFNSTDSNAARCDMYTSINNNIPLPSRFAQMYCKSDRYINQLYTDMFPDVPLDSIRRYMKVAAITSVPIIFHILTQLNEKRMIEMIPLMIPRHSPTSHYDEQFVGKLCIIRNVSHVFDLMANVIQPLTFSRYLFMYMMQQTELLPPLADIITKYSHRMMDILPILTNYCDIVDQIYQHLNDIKWFTETVVFRLVTHIANSDAHTTVIKQLVRLNIVDSTTILLLLISTHATNSNIVRVVDALGRETIDWSVILNQRHHK